MHESNDVCNNHFAKFCNITNCLLIIHVVMEEMPSIQCKSIIAELPSLMPWARVSRLQMIPQALMPEMAIGLCTFRISGNDDCAILPCWVLVCIWKMEYKLVESI